MLSNQIVATVYYKIAQYVIHIILFWVFQIVYEVSDYYLSANEYSWMCGGSQSSMSIICMKYWKNYIVHSLSA